LDLRGNIGILEHVAENSETLLDDRLKTVRWLRDNLRTSVASDVIYSIVAESWIEAAKLASESNVTIAALHFLRAVRPFRYIHKSNMEVQCDQLLTELPKFAEVTLAPELVHQFERITLGYRPVPHLNFRLLFLNNNASITPEGARCVARHFSTSTIIDCLEFNVMTPDLSLEMLEEVHKCLEVGYKPQAKRNDFCVAARNAARNAAGCYRGLRGWNDADQSEETYWQSRSGDRIRRRNPRTGYVAAFGAFPSEIYENDSDTEWEDHLASSRYFRSVYSRAEPKPQALWTKRNFKEIIRNLVRYLPSGSSALMSSAPYCTESLVQIILRIRYRCDYGGMCPSPTPP
jgi:hypothetical protein